ncbi:hypothetical protein, partial [Streptomyces sp. NPDC058486]
LALIFGTLLSSQGADASFVPVSRPSGRFLRFLRFPALPTLSDPFGVRFPVRRGLSFRLSGRSDE